MRKRSKGDLLTRVKYPVEPLWERQLWKVAESYEVKDGKLFPQGKECARHYAPLKTPELPTELQRVATGNLSPIEFAGQFGLLGYRNLTGYQQHEGDPLDWVVAHARTVHFCLQFIGMLQEDASEEEIRYELEQFPDGPYALLEKIIEIDLRCDISPPKNETEKKLRGHVKASHVARIEVCKFVSYNIERVGRRLLTDRFATKIDSYISFHAMIEAVYWQLADRIEGGGVRRCLACKQFFVARDKRQQYCPPWPGSTRSRCSARLNVQNFRSREKVGEA